MASKRRPGRLDASLLPSLDALLSEGNVTRAAARLGVTQSAVSHSLRKLRAHFGDPLLVRTPEGMVLTERARRLADVVRESLEAIDRADRDGQAFDPQTARRTFRIAMSDYVGLELLPRLLATLAEEAPGIDLDVRPVVADVERALGASTLDLVIGNARADVPGLYRKKLIEARWAAILREGHPALARPMTLDAYAALSHVTVSLRGGRGFVDDELARRGVPRRKALVVPQFALAAFVVARTDLVFTLPDSAARRFAELLPLRVFEPPLALPGLTFWQIWHERSQNDAAHAWLREAVTEAARTRT